MKKNSCTLINPKKIFMLRPNKNSYKEFDNKKKFLRLENSPPPPLPITFLMVRPLGTLLKKTEHNNLVIKDRL